MAKGAFVSGFLRMRTRPPGRPDQGLPGGGGDGDGGEYPDQGLPGEGAEGEGEGIPGQLPSPPPGIWPPLRPGHPIAPVPPSLPNPPPPGSIWPPVEGVPSGKFWIVAGIPGVGWRYVCVDPSLKPTPK
jgi:hypothetical protein